MVGKHQNNFTIKDLTMIAMLTAILFVQEEVLTFLPNVQLSVFLIVLYSKKIGFTKTTIIIILHVILDNLIMGSLSMVYTPAMFIGWMFIPIIFCTILKDCEKPLILAVGASICSFLYCWVFIIPNYFMFNIDPIVYLASDLAFELILAVTGFATVLLLYKPCSKAFDKIYNWK